MKTVARGQKSERRGGDLCSAFKCSQKRVSFSKMQAP